MEEKWRHFASLEFFESGESKILVLLMHSLSTNMDSTHEFYSGKGHVVSTYAYM
jgi:hypothetical protein